MGAKDHLEDGRMSVVVPEGTPAAAGWREQWLTVGLCTLVASLSLFLLGYDVGIVAGALLFFEVDYPLLTWEVEVLTAAVDCFTLFGSLLAGWAADRYGRRPTMLAGAVIFLLGAIVMAAAVGFWSLFFGRAISGLGMGIAVLVAPLYTGELVPEHVRGFLVGAVELSLSIGMLSGFGAALVFTSLPQGWNWRIMFGCVIVPALVLLTGCVIMPESPRWKAAEGKSDEALLVLLRTSGTQEKAVELLQGIEQVIKLEQDRTVSWLQLLMPTDRTLRNLLLIGCGLAFLQQAMGIDAALYYAPRTLESLGVESVHLRLGASVLIGLVKAGGTLSAVLVLDRVGRRPLLLTSGVGVVIALSMVGFGFLVASTWTTVLVISGLCLYVALFSLGFGPVFWVFMSEIYPQQVRSRAMSLCISVNRISSFICAATYLSLNEVIGVSGTFFLYASLGVIACNFTYFLIPETKNRSLESISLAAYADELLPSPTDGEDEDEL